VCSIDETYDLLLIFLLLTTGLLQSGLEVRLPYMKTSMAESSKP
jgi:biopolymer transport protein ExbD